MEGELFKTVTTTEDRRGIKTLVDIQTLDLEADDILSNPIDEDQDSLKESDWLVEEDMLRLTDWDWLRDLLLDDRAL